MKKLIAVILIAALAISLLPARLATAVGPQQTKAVVQAPRFYRWMIVWSYTVTRTVWSRDTYDGPLIRRKSQITIWADTTYGTGRTDGNGR